VVDGFAGWDPKYRLKIRIVATRPYHALFMHNMLIRPSKEELADYGDPDYVIFNAGRFPANPLTKHMTSRTSVELSFDRKEFVILGTEYAGEMKKGVFTIMNYIMPKQGVLSMHSSANVGKSGDVAIFFGLSGTGKRPFLQIRNGNLLGMMNTAGPTMEFSILKAAATQSASIFLKKKSRIFSKQSVLVLCWKMWIMTKKPTLSITMEPH